MRQILLSLLVAVSSMTCNAALWIGGAQINDEVIARGIADSLNNRDGVTVTGSITMNAAKDTLTLDNCTIEDANNYSVPSIDRAPLCFEDVTNLTIVIKGKNRISSTSADGYNDAVKVVGLDSVLFVGEGKKDSLVLTTSSWFAVHMAGDRNGLIEFKNLYLKTSEMSQNNSFGPGLAFDNVNANIFEIERLNSITFKDCAIVSPEGATLEYDENHGWSVSQNTLIIKAAPQKGDTIRYEYAGNNLFYRIYNKEEGKYIVYGANGGAAYPAEAPTGNVIFPDSIQDFMGVKYAVLGFGSALKNCEGVTGLELNNLMDQLTSYNLSGTSITSIDTKNVKSIAYAAFYGVKVTNVHIGPALKSFYANSYMLDSAVTVTIDEANPNLKLDGSMLITKNGDTLVGMPTKIADAVYRLPKTLKLIMNDVVTKQKGTLIYPKVIPFQTNNTNPGPWSLQNCPLGDVIVPCGLLSEFITGDFGKNFSQANSVTEQLVFDLTLTQTEGGTIAYTKQLACNEIELTATPEAGYQFIKWNDDNTEATRIVAVSDDVEFSAIFESQTGLDELQSQGTSHKIIKDGQLLIIRDGKTFNPLGTEVH